MALSAYSTPMRRVQGIRGGGDKQTDIRGRRMVMVVKGGRNKVTKVNVYIRPCLRLYAYESVFAVSCVFFRCTLRD